MSGVYHLVLFFFISHLAIFSLAQEENGSSPKCQSFVCGILSRIGFPFSNETFPKCGFLTVKGCKEQVQRIQLGENGPEFQLLSISKDNTLSLRHPGGFQNPPLGNKSCVDYLQNLTIPSSNFLSFEVNPKNQTLFRCPGKTYTVGVNFTSLCNGSRDSIVYYNGTKPGGSSAPPQDCSLILFQSNKDEKGLHFSNLFTGLFQLQVIVTSECHECHHIGGTCRFDNNGEFQCPGARSGDGKSGLKLSIGLSISGTAILIVLAVFFLRKLSRPHSVLFGNKKSKDYQNIEASLRNCGSLAPKRYSFSDIKKMTHSFKHKLGQGGYGAVYKGKLFDGSCVAVKVLTESKGDGEEFINEVASISMTSHVNIVTLLGFCFEGQKRALIYKFMSNGSLEKFIHEKGSLKWETLYQIIVGVARGLEYLHRGCNTRILHFDIKPHNILLDEDFCPKISDFGLAKICPKKESIVSMSGARGTVGYIAPEVFSKNFGVVSHKSDVYSYGMMVLEITGGRQNNNIQVDNSSESYFPQWIYRRLEEDKELGLHGISNEEDKEIVRKMIIVSLWCIQTNPSERPTMSRVVEMLEGSLHSLQIPPKPFLSSPRSTLRDSSISIPS